MNKKRLFATLWAIALVAALVLAQPLMSTGCGGCSKEKPIAAPPPPPPPPAPKAEPAPAPPPAPKAEPAKAAAAASPAGAPLTYSVLRLAPESTMITLALPPVQGILDKVVAMAKRIAPTGVDIDAQVAKGIEQMAGDAGMSGAKSLPEIAKAKGFNPDAPVAAFVDLTQTAASAKAGLTALKAEIEAAKAAANAAKEAEKKETEKKADEKKEGEKAAPKEGEPKKEEAKKDEPKKDAPPAPKPPDIGKVWASLKIPAITLVLGCADAAAVDATIKGILSGSGGYVDPAKVEDSDVNGVKVHCYDPEKFAYAIAGDKVIASNSLTMLKETLARVSAPANVRYGTPECPATAPDEIVMLTRADKLAPLVKDLVPAIMSVDPSLSKYSDAQGKMLDKTLDALRSDDPLVTTLAWTDKKIELMSRVDNTKHAAVAELTGPAKPMRLAPLLPDTTLVMLSLRFNDQTKANLKDGWLNALPPDLQKEAGVAQAMNYVNNVLGLLGDELTIGIAGAQGGLPQLILMAAMGNPEQTKSFLQALAPMTPGEPHAGVDISLLAVPAPIPFYIAFPGDTLVIANDQEKLKGIIDLMQAKSASKLFASLEPPIDLAMPTFGALLLKTSLLTDVVVPLAGLAGGIPPAMQMPITKISEILREVRITKSVENNWYAGRLTLLLK